jgi:serine/threonine protein kinase
MAWTSGTRPGVYEVISATGAGGMGEGDRARDTRFDRTVAIKILPALVSADPEARQRIDREARAAASRASADFPSDELGGGVEAALSPPA